MTVRVGTGWQTTFADLSLVLFMATASGLARQPAEVRPLVAPRPAAAATKIARAEPVAVWIAGAGAPPLAQWLAQQPRDARQQITVTAAYAPGGMAQALAAARKLADQAGDGARIAIEPGVPQLQVILAYDAPPTRLARGLPKAPDSPPSGAPR